MSIASEQFLYYTSVRFQQIKEANKSTDDGVHVLSSHLEQEANSLLEKIVFDNMPTPQIAFSCEDGFIEIEFLVNNESLILLLTEDYENPQENITLYFTANHFEEFSHHYEKVDQIQDSVIQKCIDKLTNMSASIEHRLPHFTETTNGRV